MSTLVNRLPCLGVGASLSLEAEPDPAHLAAQPGGPSFVEYAGKASYDAVADDVGRVLEAGASVLFHPSYINFCGTFENASEWLDETARHLAATGSPWFAQDLAYCAWGGNPGYSTQLGFFLPPILNAESLESACARVLEVKARVPVAVAVEPPPFNFVVGNMGLMPYFRDLTTRTDIAILLDAGHMVSYELAAKKKIFDEDEGFPWDRVVELHVAGGRIEVGEDGERIYVDAHERPILDETWEMLCELLQRADQVRAVCFECEGTTEEEVLSTLEKVRRLVIEHSTSEAMVARVEEELRGTG
jgi:uncharacterized protein (UPF0276 family)